MHVISCLIFSPLAQLGRSFDRVYYAVIALIVIGVGLASYGEVEFHALGFMVSCVLHSGYSALSCCLFLAVYAVGLLPVVVEIGDVAKVSRWQAEVPSVRSAAAHVVDGGDPDGTLLQLRAILLCLCFSLVLCVYFSSHAVAF